MSCSIQTVMILKMIDMIVGDEKMNSATFCVQLIALILNKNAIRPFKAYLFFLVSIEILII
jgi:hypothetical protein